EQPTSLAAPAQTTGGGQRGREASFDPLGGGGDAGALEALLARGPGADLLAGRCRGLRDGPRQEIGSRDAPAMIVQEVVRDPGGGPVDHQTYQGGRGEGVDLHVVDEQAARP